MIHEVVRIALAQIPTDGLEQLKNHIDDGGEVLMDGRIYDYKTGFS